MTKVVTFGAFVEIMPGVEGLVHISELAQHHVENPREVVSQGDVVNVKIIEVDAERRRLSLSLKRVDEGDDVQPRADGQPLETPAPTPPPQIDLSEDVFPEGEAEPAAEEPACGGEAEPAAEAARRSPAEEPPPRDRRRGRAEIGEPDELRAEPTKPRRASRPTQSTRRTRGRAIPRVTPQTRPKRLRSRQESRPLAVAITGGIGAGKSEALAAFARHGAATISSDEVVHELYEDPEVQARAGRAASATSDRRAVGEQASSATATR